MRFKKGDIVRISKKHSLINPRLGRKKEREIVYISEDSGKIKCKCGIWFVENELKLVRRPKSEFDNWMNIMRQNSILYHDYGLSSSAQFFDWDSDLNRR